MSYLSNNGLLDNLWSIQNVPYKRQISACIQELDPANTAVRRWWYSSDKGAQPYQIRCVIKLEEEK